MARALLERVYRLDLVLEIVLKRIVLWRHMRSAYNLKSINVLLVKTYLTQCMEVDIVTSVNITLQFYPVDRLSPTLF